MNLLCKAAKVDPRKHKILHVGRYCKRDRAASLLFFFRYSTDVLASMLRREIQIVKLYPKILEVEQVQLFTNKRRKKILSDLKCHQNSYKKHAFLLLPPNTFCLKTRWKYNLKITRQIDLALRYLANEWSNLTSFWPLVALA